MRRMRRSAAATNETLERLPALVFVMLFASPLRWEALATARPFTGDATRRWRNLAISLVNFLLGGLVAATLLAASAWIAKVEVGIAAWSDSAAAMIGVLLLDMTDYWRHRLSHRWQPLWRLHRLHHTDPRIDVTTALRSHPIEQLLRPLFLVGAIVAFGIPPFAVLGYPLLGLPVLLFQHANVQLPASLDRALVWLLSTPSMHLVHHSRRPVETDSSYATGLTLWDRLFGTFSASTPPHGIGLDGFDMPPQQTLRGMLRNPWEDATSRR
jgi:sterol desaturase/sphingolipid hydroxylase (fatty acid hydroxylase superfamily)